MLPKTGDILRADFTIRKQPSKTYRLKDVRVIGNVEGIEAVKQSVFCILNTERFEHIVYSWNYGREFVDLYGGSMGVLESKIKKRIKEALIQDDRIRSVGAFSFTRYKNQVIVTFTVSSDAGVFAVEKEVSVNV